MTATENFNSEFDIERRDRKKRTGRVVLIVLLLLVVAVSFVLYLELSGSRGGEFIDRITVTSYLRSRYGKEAGKFNVEFTGYDKARGVYEYDCSCERGSFRMASKNFRVRYDGYYAEFMCDPNAGQAVQDYLSDYLSSRWDEAEKGASWTLSAKIRVPLEDAGLSPTEMLEKYGNTLDVEATLTGERLTFGQYKNLSYDLLDTVRSTLKLAPEFMQIFYYRYPEAGEGGDNVLSYESHLRGYMFNYTKDGYSKSTDVNFVVELGEKEQKSLRNYTIIRVVNFLVIGLTVVALLTLYVVRKVKKKKKSEAALAKANDGGAGEDGSNDGASE